MTQGQTRKAHLIEDLVTLRREVEHLKPLSERTKRAEDELDNFFAQSLDLLCIAGLDGYFKRLNPAWTACLGWTQEELKAQPFLGFVHADDHESTLAALARLSEAIPVIRFENRYRHQDGSYHWLQWNARSGPEGLRIYAAARDVTEQKRQEKEILAVADREKERLGRELHDGLCQSLAGIAALSATLSRNLAACSESSASAAAAKITKLINATMVEARDLARGLGPISLRETDLNGALEALALNVQHLYRVSCTLECDGTHVRLHPAVEQHLFRIAQEAVQNALTHGKGDRIEISLGSKNGEGVLSVRDNGRGMPDEVTDPDGIGIHTMAYRARLIGASLEVRRRTPHGTAISCAFSLTATPAPETTRTMPATSPQLGLRFEKKDSHC